MRSGGVAARPSLYSSTISSRNVLAGPVEGHGHADRIGGRGSGMTSIEVKPCTALVTVPAGGQVDGQGEEGPKDERLAVEQEQRPEGGAGVGARRWPWPSSFDRLGAVVATAVRLRA